MTATHVITLSGEVDMLTASKLGNTLRAAVDAAQADLVVVDVSAVTFIDSSGLGLLLSLYKRQQLRDARIALHGVSPFLVKLLTVTQMNEILPVLHTLPADQAVTSDEDAPAPSGAVEDAWRAPTVPGRDSSTGWPAQRAKSGG